MNSNSKIYIAGHSELVGSTITRQLELEIKSYNNLIYKSIDELDLLEQSKVQAFF